MSSDCVLVDTSAWIAFFRSDDVPAVGVVDRLLESERVAIAGVVRAELLQGCRSEKDYARLSRLLDALHLLPEPPDLWERVARLGFRLRRAGVNGVGIADQVIAVTASANDAAILSLDAPFPLIAGVLSISLVGG